MGSTVFERLRPDPRVVAESLDGSRLSPFWLEGLASTSFPTYSGTDLWDLAVVGGGYTGLWTALQAKERDPSLRVVVLEGKTIGHAASGRNGGFVEATLTHGEANGKSRFPQEYERLDQLGLENLDELEATIIRLGIDCDFERTGSLAVATEDYQVDELRSAHNGTTEIFYDTDGVREQLASPTYLAGLWSTRSTAIVNPGKLAAGLAKACADAGVEIFEHSPVKHLDSELLDSPVTLTLDGGFVRADKVALATNAYPSLLARFRLHTVPVYDYVLMTEPLTDAQLSSIGWNERQGVADTANQFHYYRLTADNRILWGGYDAIYHYGGDIRPEYEDRPATFEKLAHHFFTTFPQLEGLKFTHRWAGVIDTSTRFCAFYSLARQGRVAYAAGFTGLGVGTARFAAEVLLDLLSGEATERTELEMVRRRGLPFPPEPAATIGINLSRWSMDRADHRGGRRNLFLKAMDAVGLGFDS